MDLVGRPKSWAQGTGHKVQASANWHPVKIAMGLVHPGFIQEVQETVMYTTGPRFGMHGTPSVAATGSTCANH